MVFFLVVRVMVIYLEKIEKYKGKNEVGVFYQAFPVTIDVLRLYFACNVL